MTSRSLGACGEALAVAYLLRHGYRILGRNVRAGGVEIDVVASRPGWVVFVEVKTRRSRHYGAPEEAVDARKRARLVRGAGAWLTQRRTRSQHVRFDVITCEPDATGTFRVRHLEGAFDASD